MTRCARVLLDVLRTFFSGFMGNGGVARPDRKRSFLRQQDVACPECMECAEAHGIRKSAEASSMGCWIRHVSCRVFKVQAGTFAIHQAG